MYVRMHVRMYRPIEGCLDCMPLCSRWPEIRVWWKLQLALFQVPPAEWAGVLSWLGLSFRRIYRYGPRNTLLFRQGFANLNVLSLLNDSRCSSSCC